MTMSRGIRVSDKHGVNPSLEICFWCGESKGVILCGRLKGDAEAPHEMVINLEPCDACKKKFAQGVQLIEVTDDGSRFNDNEAFAIKAEGGKTVWPTGRYVVMRPEALKNGKPGGKALCDKETMDVIVSNSESGSEKDRK